MSAQRLPKSDAESRRNLFLADPGSANDNAGDSLEISSAASNDGALARKLVVSLVLPAFNEAGILPQSLEILCDYMRSLEHKYGWEIVIVNDGSSDNTSALAHDLASRNDNIRVVDHVVNFGLGQALKSGFNHARGDCVVTLDMDLSYSPGYIEKLVDTLIDSRAKIVIASPYVKGGAVENVPAFRKLLSVGANLFLSIGAHGKVKTLTGMVRAYDVRFLRTLDFYSMGMEVNSEILYKAMVLRARIVEIPATLRWKLPDPAAAKVKPVRKSSMRIGKYLATLLVSGFLYRPILMFLVPGLMALGLFVWCGLWMLIDIIQTGGIAAAWAHSQYTFVIGGLSLLAAIQLLSNGLISLQNKCYFEQMFHLGTTNYRMSRQTQEMKQSADNQQGIK